MAKSCVRKYTIWGFSLFIFSFVFYYVLLPKIVKSQVKAQVELRPEKFMRKIWSAFPFSFEYNIYLFNITNPDEISKGEKPIVKEIGPFVYDEWQEKTNQIDHEDDDSVSFTFKYTYYFNAEKSNGLTDEEVLVVPHYFILGLVNTLKLENPTLLPAVGKGIDSIFQKPKNIFMQHKVKDLLFDGFTINCTVKDFAGAAICNEIRGQYEELRLIKVEEDIYKMSLLGWINGTSSHKRVRVLRGAKDIMKVGRIIQYDGKPNISLWNDEKCDSFNNATDGTVYHPFYKKDDYLRVFVEAVCRSISFDYLEDGKVDGVKTFRYTTNMGTDPENNPQDKCYCSTPDTCPLKGAFDAYKCAKVPLLVTNPHFYLADPYYLSLIDGLNPDKEKHMVILDLDPLSGVPLHAHARAQLNMHITKIQKIKMMKNLPDAVLPLFWFDNVLYLPDFLMKNVKDGSKHLFFAKIAFYLMASSGLGMVVYATIMYFKKDRKKNNLELQRTIPATNEINRSNSGDKSMPLNVGKLQPAYVPSRID